MHPRPPPSPLMSHLLQQQLLLPLQSPTPAAAPPEQSPRPAGPHRTRGLQKDGQWTGRRQAPARVASHYPGCTAAAGPCSWGGGQQGGRGPRRQQVMSLCMCDSMHSTIGTMCKSTRMRIELRVRGSCTRHDHVGVQNTHPVPHPPKNTHRKRTRWNAAPRLRSM
jgi:hypothetical protein